ncbi:MAG: hypothetical protein WC948_04145, partial [Thermovirgaceae bacterium]
IIVFYYDVFAEGDVGSDDGVAGYGHGDLRVRKARAEATGETNAGTRPGAVFAACESPFKPY